MKVRDSSRSGAGAGEIYKPVWFAYAYMDSFLGEGLEVRKTTDTINQVSLFIFSNIVVTLIFMKKMSIYICVGWKPIYLHWE